VYAPSAQINRSRGRSSFSSSLRSRRAPSRSCRLAVWTRAEHEAAGVHEDVALPAREPLGSVVTAFRSSYPGALDRLAVDHRPARVAVASFCLAQRLTKPIVGLAQPTVSAPLAEVVVDGLPGRLLPWQHPPGAAGAQQVEDGVGYAPGRPLRWAATRLSGDSSSGPSSAHSVSVRSEGYGRRVRGMATSGISGNELPDRSLSTALDRSQARRSPFAKQFLSAETWRNPQGRDLREAHGRGVKPERAALL